VTVRAVRRPPVSRRKKAPEGRKVPAHGVSRGEGRRAGPGSPGGAQGSSPRRKPWGRSIIRTIEPRRGDRPAAHECTRPSVSQADRDRAWRTVPPRGMGQGRTSLLSPLRGSARPPAGYPRLAPWAKTLRPIRGSGRAADGLLSGPGSGALTGTAYASRGGIMEREPPVPEGRQPPFSSARRTDKVRS
jgi:hypothetical protein